MKNIPNNSVDMVLCDLPFGTTKCHGDSILDLEKLWHEYNRIVKSNAAILHCKTDNGCVLMHNLYY